MGGLRCRVVVCAKNCEKQKKVLNILIMNEKMQLNRGSLDIQMWVLATWVHWCLSFRIRIARRLSIQTWVGNSSDRICSDSGITNHPGLGIWIRIRAIKVWIPRHLWIQAGLGVWASKLVHIEFVRIANHQSGASVSQWGQFRYRQPSVCGFGVITHL